MYAYLHFVRMYVCIFIHIHENVCMHIYIHTWILGMHMCICVHMISQSAHADKCQTWQRSEEFWRVFSRTLTVWTCFSCAALSISVRSAVTCSARERERGREGEREGGREGRERECVRVCVCLCARAQVCMRASEASDANGNAHHHHVPAHCIQTKVPEHICIYTIH